MAKMVCGSEQLAEFWGEVENVQTLEDKITKYVQIQAMHQTAILQFWIQRDPTSIHFAMQQSISQWDMSGA